MNIELLNKYKVIEWIYNYWLNKIKLTNQIRLILILNKNTKFKVKEILLN